MAVVRLATILVLLAGCSAEPPGIVQPPPPEVTVSRPESREVTEYLDFTGRTESPQVVEVRPRVSGYLVKVYFNDGQEVKEGDPLFDIDPRPFEAAMGQAKAEVARVDASLKKAIADLARNQKLRPSGAVSQEELDSSIAEKAVAEASIAAAREAVTKAALDLEFAKITAPIAGRISTAKITVGNLVAPGTEATSLLSTIVSVDPMHVYFDVDERSLLRYAELIRESGRLLDLKHVKQLNLPVHVGLANEEGCPHQGMLDFVDNQINPSTGTIRTRAELPNADRAFVPGLFVRVRLPIGEPRQALLVTDRAVATDQSVKYVLVVNDQNQVERRDVKLGSLSEGLRIVESGLKPEDRVIVNGIQRARAGLTVNPKEGA
jgi:RND family efflux transporter MFP subunit